MNANASFEIGMLVIRPFRQLLEQAAFDYPDLEWTEGTGILSRMFYVRGPEKVITAIANRVKKYKEANR